MSNPATSNEDTSTFESAEEERRRLRREEFRHWDCIYNTLLKDQFNGNYPSWPATVALEHMETHCPRLYQLMYEDDSE